MKGLRKMSIQAVNHNVEVTKQIFLIIDSQDIKEVLESNGINPEYHEDITGIKAICDGFGVDYFLTESSTPYSIYAEYDIIDYWID